MIQQVAPDADVEVVRVLDTDGLGDEIAIGQQLVAAAQRGVQIVNLSLGTVTADDSPPLVLETALRAAIAAQPNILFVCAAGNYADERPCWPAAFAADPEFSGTRGLGGRARASTRPTGWASSVPSGPPTATP